MSPQTNAPQTSKVKVLNKPLHTLADAERKTARDDEPSEVTCPIVRETL